MRKIKYIQFCNCFWRSGWLMVGLWFALLSCNEPTDSWPVLQKAPKPSGKYKNGILIINEGNFGWGFGTLSFYNFGSRTVEHDLFRTINGRILGNVAQSALLLDTLLYIVVNNSRKIEVLSANTLKSLRQITGLVSPRYLMAQYPKAYCTDLYDDAISVLDLSLAKVLRKISAPGWTERIIGIDDEIFVEDRTGGILVIRNDSLTQRIELGSPANGLSFWKSKLWTVADDKLIAVDPKRKTITDKLNLPPSPNRARIVIASADELWVLFGHLWQFDGKSFAMAFSGEGKNFYALAAKGRTVALADAHDYVRPSTIYLLENKIPADTIEGGVITGEMYFID